MVTLKVSSNADWEQLRNRNLMTIVDPMVFRTADLFLSGRPFFAFNDSVADQVWETISKNIGALASFFDGIILRQQLPIFSYTVTFQEGRLLELNEEGDFLVPVVVEGEVYKKSKASAVQELNLSRPIPQKLGDDILTEMEVFGYAWQPYFDGLESLTPREQRLQSFLLGGLIFGGYAQQLSIRHETAEHQAEHILQPKRSRLFLAASLGDVGTITTDESSLLRRFKQLSKSLPLDAMHAIELPPAPTFLPLLLRQNPSTPRELLELALEWREKLSVRAFRDWYRNIEIELHRHYYPVELEKELRQLQTDISRELGRTTEKTVTISAKVGASLKMAPKPEVGAEAGVGVERQLELGRIKWFFQNLLPGYSYRKLFVRMAIAQKRYADLTQHLRELWHRQPA